MSSNNETLRQIEDLVKSERVVLFMKGSRSFPQCGFSAAVVQILNSLLPEYKTVNVLSDPGIRQGVKDFSSWPTVPQLYIGGEFVGGSDIVRELYATGELQKKLQVEATAIEPPAVTVTATASQALRDALAEAGPDEHVHLAVSQGFEHELSLGPRRPGEIEVTSTGVTLLVDPLSAKRANGLTVDFVSGPDGSGFRMDNPNAPASVRPLGARDLKARLDAGEVAHLDGLDRSTPIAFYCHHGQRSRAAAERFLALGFRDVYNLEGGIDAWSREVDPKVPRYS